MTHRLHAAALLALSAACAGTGGAPPAPAPVSTPAPRGVETITAASVRQRIFVVADDSMAGRGTPSPGLERMARYAVAEFQRLGLTPGGTDGSYLQRYPLEVHHLVAESSFVSVSGPASARWQLGRDAVLGEGTAPAAEVAGVPTLVTGNPQQGGTLDPAMITDRIVILPVGPYTNAIAGQLIPLRPAAALAVLSDSLWTMAPGQSTVRVSNPASAGSAMPIPPIVFVPEAGVLGWLAPLGVTRESLHADGPLATRSLAGAELRLRAVERLVERTAAPNVVGIIPGSDPVLKDEYVLFTAHMDHIGTASGGQGCAARGADTICNGADDDGSGTVAVLELAEAFATAATRPRRSILLALVSGEERGLWGSAQVAAQPPVPLAQVVANLNSDMVGRSDSLRDSMAVIGREHSNLGETLDRVAVAHPELRLTPVGDLWPQEGLFFRSDHVSFAHRGVPVLFFTSGLHPDYHGAGDTPDRIDHDKLARYARLAYFLGMEIANADARPQWNPESYQRIVQQGQE